MLGESQRELGLPMQAAVWRQRENWEKTPGTLYWVSQCLSSIKGERRELRDKSPKSQVQRPCWMKSEDGTEVGATSVLGIENRNERNPTGTLDLCMSTKKRHYTTGSGNGLLTYNSGASEDRVWQLRQNLRHINYKVKFLISLSQFKPVVNWISLKQQSPY